MVDDKVASLLASMDNLPQWDPSLKLDGFAKGAILTINQRRK
jgi:hypothetical protein